MSSGRVIAFEGPDGAGKTTQLKLYQQYLESKGTEVVVSAMSGGSEISNLLRQASFSDAERPPETDFHISLAMAWANRETIVRAKSKGKTVLIDRSPITWLAYNGYGSEKKDKQDVEKAILEFLGVLEIDDLIYFEIDQDTANERRRARTDKKSDYFERMPAEYHDRVRKGYKRGLELVRKQNTTKIHTTDANKSIEQIHIAVQKAL